MAAADWGVAAAAVAAPVALAAWSIVGDSSLTWFATRPLHWPALHVGPTLALVALLAPIALPRRWTT